MLDSKMPNGENPPQKSNWSAIYQAILGGAAAGAAEVAVDHPFWTLKTRYQNDQIPKAEKFTMDPRVLYRGFWPNILSMAPITALQVSVAAGLKSVFHRDNNHPPSELEALSYSAAGGAVSSIVGGPTEYTMAHQTAQRGFYSTLKDLIKMRGIRALFTGMPGTAVRDAKFTMGFGFGAPYLKEQATPYMPENAAAVVGGIGAGVPVAVLSQPWDSLKTAQQTAMSPEGNHPVTPLWRLAKEKIQREGVAGLYKGSFWRMGRVTSAVMLMSEVNERVSSWLKPKQ